MKKSLIALSLGLIICLPAHAFSFKKFRSHFGHAAGRATVVGLASAGAGMKAYTATPTYPAYGAYGSIYPAPPILNTANSIHSYSVRESGNQTTIQQNY